MMKSSKILININNLNEIEEYKKIGINNFLFAVDEYSIGYKTFPLSEIPDDAYLYINRVMDTNSIDSFIMIIPELKRFKGIIFEDLGIFNILKNQGYNLIWFQNHFTTNKASLSYYLNNGCMSAVLSNEITESEIKENITTLPGKLILNVLGKNNIMYSRRTLLTNFNKHASLDDYNDMELSTGKNTFFARENEYGTLLFNNEYFNYIPLANTLSDEDLMFYLILNLDLKPSDIKKIIEGASFGNDGFLNKKTVYKMSEYDDKKVIS